MRLAVIVSLTMVAMLMLATDAAQAIQIKNLTQGTTLFDSGGFEGETPGGDPVNPLVGTYNINPPSRHGLGTVLGLIPGAFEGQQYLKQTSPQNTRETIFASPAVTGDVIQIEFALYLTPGSGETRFRLTGSAAGNHEIGLFDLVPDAHIFGWNEVTGYPSVNFGIVPASNTWHTVVINHTVGSNDTTLTFDGVSHAGTGMIADGRGDIDIVDRIRWNGPSGPNPVYVDSIPEPASLAMIGLGGLLALRRRHA